MMTKIIGLTGGIGSGKTMVAKYIKSLGYDVYVIDKDEVFGANEKRNSVPKKAFNETGNYPIEYRIDQIKKCSFLQIRNNYVRRNKTTNKRRSDCIFARTNWGKERATRIARD